MKLIKYIGMDVHKAMTVIAVLDRSGKTLAEAITEVATTHLDPAAEGIYMRELSELPKRFR